ncbi:MAG: cache domain-containing protein, partial [Candidatus Omnitrophota bacterium]
ILLLLMALCFCLYAILTGIIVPQQNFLLAQWLNYDWFIRVFAVPVQLLRGIMALLMAVCVGCYSFLNSLPLSKKSNIPFFRRIISLLIATIMLLCAVFSVGFVVVNNLTRPELRRVLDYNLAGVSLLTSHLIERFTVVQRISILLSNSPDIISQLSAEKEKNSEYMRLLDRQSKILPDTICYLLDINGKCLDSSNRNRMDSFVGHSYTFRPYFTEAVKGGLSTYFAYGITSNKRGFYAAAPVKDNSGTIMGVVVVKKDIDEDATRFYQYPFAFFVDRNGIILLSSKPKYTFKSMWPIEEKLHKQITDSRQFGKLSFDPLLPKQITSGQWIRFGNSFYYIGMNNINIAGWSVVLFTDANSVIIYRLFGILIVFFSVLLIIAGYLVLLKREEFLLAQSLSRDELNQAYDMLRETKA